MTLEFSVGAAVRCNSGSAIFGFDERVHGTPIFWRIRKRTLKDRIDEGVRRFVAMSLYIVTDHLWSDVEDRAGWDSKVPTCANVPAELTDVDTKSHRPRQR
jgi:hypothetical protein